MRVAMVLKIGVFCCLAVHQHLRPPLRNWLPAHWEPDFSGRDEAREFPGDHDGRGADQAPRQGRAESSRLWHDIWQRQDS